MMRHQTHLAREIMTMINHNTKHKFKKTAKMMNKLYFKPLNYNLEAIDMSLVKMNQAQNKLQQIIKRHKQE